MAELNIEAVIKSGVEKALNKPIVDGKSITEWAAIGMKAPRWISVKDRLPETNDEVLTTYLYDNEPGKHYVETASYFDDGEGEGHWHSVCDEFSIGRVRKTTIAWMPMPKPYKPPKED